MLYGLTKERYNSISLLAPVEYWAISIEDRKKYTNGCGPGGWLIDVVPDTMWGLDISPCCDIHDYMYRFGQYQEQKYQADHIFLENLITLIDSESKFFILRNLRLYRAVTYFIAVRDFGNAAFWVGKGKLVESK